MSWKLSNKRGERLRILIRNLPSLPPPSSFILRNFFPQTYFKISFVSFFLYWTETLVESRRRSHANHVANARFYNTWFAYVKYLRKLGKSSENPWDQKLWRMQRALPAQCSRSFAISRIIFLLVCESLLSALSEFQTADCISSPPPVLNIMT